MADHADIIADRYHGLAQRGPLTNITRCSRRYTHNGGSIGISTSRLRAEVDQLRADVRALLHDPHAPTRVSTDNAQLWSGVWVIEIRVMAR